MTKVSKVLAMFLMWGAVIGGSAWAQPWHGQVDADFAAMEVFQGLHAAIQADDAVAGAFAELMATAYAGAESLSGAPSFEGEAGAICAFLVGAAGNPRLDGGGNLLVFRPTSVVPAPWVVQLGQPERGPSADLWPAEATSRLVIIDEFDLDELTKSVDSILSANGAVVVAPGDRGPHALWFALYGHFLALDSSAAVADVAVPHGHLVAFHALAHLGPEARIVQLARQAHGDYDVAVLVVALENQPGATFEVHLVDVDFNRFESIASAFDASRQEPDDVVVTSWGFVDCAIAEHYRSTAPAAGQTISAYFKDALQASGQAATVLEYLCFALSDVIVAAIGVPPDCTDPDSLADLATIVWIADVSARSAQALRWDENPGGARFFASAGNQGLAIPMPPAAWPGIVGVESCTAGNLSRRSRFSNVGGAAQASSMRALGAWFVPPINEPTELPTIGYWGTSYAAPAAAVAALAAPAGAGHVFLAPPCS